MVIKSIKKLTLPEPETVYDLQVSTDEESTFICEGVVVHNSSICIAYDGKVWYYDKDNIPTYESILYSKNGGRLRPSIMTMINKVIKKIINNNGENVKYFISRCATLNVLRSILNIKSTL